ncbi:MAG: 50S ribosomal protein L23 [Treponema sp.]|uniref:50S ribosomal protein L23 n=1 Tax=Treponema sp. TaxID=166 RepID=UPI001D6499A3|nr:50S ribosomal protein L23 [Treponema sp.]MCI5695598.1 50S ribosomal protein L23 [Spirochaetia bacterium]MBS7311122.1 50S ribosomal protein L23 [Treponema sp.]MCQ2601669.1 50S ribosomal protein L23 [Treponema sp.]MDD5810732.1 50S ribosomal protein L23 [Treponema sp.]MDY5885818.1 50S ribosomal protein L23 [Treponema sp.]
MMYQDILIKPVSSEKANNLREQDKYVFVVHPDATKTQIKEAVRKLFNVKVVSCTTMNVSGKEKRLRGRPGFTASYKKAIVRLAKGETIKVFEGV